MTAKPHYSGELRLKLVHDKPVPVIELARLYADAVRDAGRGQIVEYTVADRAGWRTGGWVDLEKQLKRLGPETDYFLMRVTDGTKVLGTRDDDTGRWDVKVTAPEPPPQDCLDAMTALTRAALALPAFVHAELQRLPGGATAFMPSPPIAGMNHVVTTTEAEVADAYDDPAIFWKAWTNVEKHGELRLCTRALDALEEEDWLEDTHLSTMELARAARPKRTQYQNAVWLDWTQPWWAFGDIQDERAGYPALKPASYDSEAGIVEYTGFITKRPLREGGADPRHVLIAEIHAVRKLLVFNKTPDGQPVRVVRVVFAEEWMAWQERRPLLDVGAEVYFRNDAGHMVAIEDRPGASS